MEYMVVILIIVGAMYYFKNYIIRGLTGRWKATSDQFGFGRQFEPHDTVECAYDVEFGQGWFDSTCVDNVGCSYGNKACRAAAISQCNRTPYCR